MNESIEIYVACHKPSELPDNPLFVPIHVGAAIAKRRLPGLVRDDEGDNISAKNPQYCEMTAQYWAWKHSKADYIGLCHYRRYLSFASERFTNLTGDRRGQVLVKSLTPGTEEKYGLLNEDAIRAVVTSHDILVGEAQDLSKVYTPFGTQPTVLKHWQAHDMALINVKDLASLFDIVRERYPDFYKDMREYLDGKYFYGFNTFVMRRDLWCELCEMEFAILAELEKHVDLTHYNQQLSRIYGFMGEIIFSSYIYHKKKRDPSLRVGERQMLYFDQTDPLPAPKPQAADTVNIVLDLGNEDGFLAYPPLAGILAHLDPARKYEIFLFCEKMDPFYRKGLMAAAKAHENVRFEICNITSFYAGIEELYKLKSHASSLFLPWIFQHFDRCVYLRWNTLVRGDIAELYDADLGGQPIAAARNIFEIGRVNTYYKEERRYAEDTLGIQDVYDFVSDEAVLLDLAVMRRLPMEELVKCCAALEHASKREIRPEEQFNVIWQGQITILPQRMNCIIVNEWEQEFYTGEAPLALMKEWKAAEEDAVVVRYDAKDGPWHYVENPAFFEEYWTIASASPFSHIFGSRLIMQAAFGTSMRQKAWRVVDRILPKHTKRREIIKDLFPRNGLIGRKLISLLGPR